MKFFLLICVILALLVLFVVIFSIGTSKKLGILEENKESDSE